VAAPPKDQKSGAAGTVALADGARRRESGDRPIFDKNLPPLTRI